MNWNPIDRLIARRLERRAAEFAEEAGHHERVFNSRGLDDIQDRSLALNIYEAARRNYTACSQRAGFLRDAAATLRGEQW